MLINIFINNKLQKLNNNYNIIQACSIFSIDIPRFCYHEKLSIAGNCRMCLVEVKGINKPIASCALPISNNMEIFTDSKLVKKAREGILEFILINHPLDCPICDQGGECDLQDQTLIFGSDKGRFYDYKRSVIEKNWGPFIKTLMTRCIHCTRCVRFIDEIAGFKYLGLAGRGNSMEIFNFSDKIILSEISGNIIDLCPVGALTSKNYSFVARSWELKKKNTIDLNDSMHSNIRIDVRDSSILRILPLFNDNLNENWITDITRFSFDGFKNNRLYFPYLKVENVFLLKNWIDIFIYLVKKIKNKKINFFIGNFIDLETAFILKKITNKYGNFSLKCDLNNFIINFFNIDFRKNYIFSANYKKLIIYKVFFLIGINLRLENALLNVKLKFIFDNFKVKIFTFGSCYNNNYFLYNFTNNIKNLLYIFEGKSLLNIFVTNNKFNIFIFGENFLNLFKNNFINLKFFYYLKDNFNYSFLNNNITNILNFDINLNFCINNFFDKTFKFFLNFFEQIDYFINIDSFFINTLSNFKIYQGHHNLNNLNFFDLILPSLTYFEKDKVHFVNFFGLIQKTRSIFFLKNTNIHSDFDILFNIFLFNFGFNFNLNNLFNDFKYYMLSLLHFYFIFFNNFILNESFISYFPNFILTKDFILTNIYKLNQIIKASLTILDAYWYLKTKYTNFA